MRKIIKTLNKNWKNLLLFEILYKVLAFWAMLPIIKGMFYLSIRASGYTYLGASNLMAYLTSPLTIFFLLLIVWLLGVCAILEMASVIYLLNESEAGRHVRLADVFAYGFERMLGLTKPQNWIVIPWLLVFLPLIGSGMAVGIFSSLSIPSFILDTIHKNAVYNTAINIVYFLLLFLSLRWCYAFHIYTLERISFWEAAKKSGKLTRHRFFKTIFRFLSLSICIFLMLLLPFVMLFIISFILLFPVFYIWGGTGITVFIIGSTMFAILLAVLLWSLSTTFIYAIISRMYYDAESAPIPSVKEVSPVITKWCWRTVLCVGVCATAVHLYAFFGHGNENFDKALSRYLASDKTQITAHRGDDINYPENTMAAFLAAVEQGADWIETDVHQTLDGVVVLTHDANLERVSGIRANVYDLTYEELKKIDVGSAFSDAFAGEYIPTLEELFQFALAYPDLHLNIELKPTGNEPGMEEKCADLIRQYDLEDRCILASLAYSSIEKIKAYDPTITCAYIMAMGSGNLNEIESADIISIEASFASTAIIERCHNAGVPVFVWTVNDEDTMRMLISKGVDNIITDDPTLGRRVIDDEQENIQKLADFLTKMAEQYRSRGIKGIVDVLQDDN